MRIVPRWTLTLPCLLMTTALSPGIAADTSKIDTSRIPLPAARRIDFTTEVYPIFKEACFSCHGPEKQKGKYRMDTREGAFKTTADHGPAIKPGKSEESALIHMVCGLIDEMLMPPPSDKPGQSEKLTPVQIGILRAWIDQGAVWPDGPIRESVQAVTFATDVGPLLQSACATCHQGTGAKGGFAVDSLASVLKGGTTYGKVIAPGIVAKSSLLTILSGKDEDLPSPEKHRLPPKQVQLVEKWIAQGAR